MNEADFLNKSKAYILQGEYEKAHIILRRALSDNPNHAEALDLAGDLALRLGRNEEAVQRFERASVSYADDKKYGEAIVCLEKAVHLDRSSNERTARLSDLYRTFGLRNRTITTVLDHCVWALDSKEEESFISGLRKIVDIQYKNLPLHLSFVKILFALNRTQDADGELKMLKALAEEAHDSAMLDEVNKLLPQTDGGDELDPKSRVELGNLLYEIGSKDEAIIEFEKAVSDLLERGETDEAIKVLNRILEVEPENKEAVGKLEELKKGTYVAPPASPETGVVVEEIPIAAEEPPEPVTEPVQEEIPKETPKEEIIPEIDLSAGPGVAPAPEAPPPEESGLEMFEDLSKEIEGFIAATEEPPAHETGVQEPAPTAESTQLEGQIADIEYLLKEAEETAPPSFEVAQEFDNFRNNVVWEKEEDIHKKSDLAKMFYDAGLYTTALSFASEIKDNKTTWPLSLEIYGGSLVKSGRYSEGMKELASLLLIDELPEPHKLELRYLLASAYEGMGDFDNAMRQIERIMSTNPQYKDVKEIYVLMGGKEVPREEVREVVEEKPVVVKEAIRPQEVPVEQPREEYPTITEEATPAPHERIPEKPPEEQPEVEEEKGEKITFL